MNTSIAQTSLRDLHAALVQSVDLVERLLADIDKHSAREDTERTPLGPGFTLHGRWHRGDSATDVFADLLKTLAERDRTFPEKYALRVRRIGRRRPYVARAPQALYPGKRHLASCCREFAPGWYLGTNESNETKLRLIRVAADVAGLAMGEELRVQF